MAKNRPKIFESQADFSRRRGVSRKTVTVWKDKGLLVLSTDGKVDVDATEWNLDQQPARYRGGVTHRPVRSSPGNGLERGNRKPKKVTNARGAQPAPSAPVQASSDSGEEEPDLSSGNLQMAEAVRRKENYLGLLRKHEFEVAQGEWVRVEEVGLLVEQQYANVRERLLIIPGKSAAHLVGLTQAEIEEHLRRDVTEALNELHDPDEFAERIAAGEASAARPAGPEAAADPQPDRMG